MSLEKKKIMLWLRQGCIVNIISPSLIIQQIHKVITKCMKLKSIHFKNFKIILDKQGYKVVL